MLPPAVPLAHGPGRAARGVPRVRRPAVRHKPEPLAEGGFVFKRLFVLAAAVAAFFVLAAGALAAVVHVRVEGRNATIFGTTEPRASGASPLEVLESASLAGEFYYHVATTSFGPYVDQIGRYPAEASS